MTQRFNPARLVIGLLVVGVALLVLWQAGLIFASKDDSSQLDGSGPALEAADAGIETAHADGRQVGLAEGNYAPDFVFSALDGSRQRLSDYRGRPVLLNFWATWCIPCRAEMPAIDQALRDHTSDRLAVIAVNNGEGAGIARRFLAQRDVHFTAFAFDPKQDVVRRYSLLGMPTSYFIDAQGIITRSVPGQLTPKLLEAGLSEAIAGYGNY